MLEVMTALAQAGVLMGNAGLVAIGIGLGFGLTILGAGKGIGNIGGHAVESIARQPEAGGPIGTNMIIAAALVEGLAIISMILLFVVTFTLPLG